MVTFVDVQENDTRAYTTKKRTEDGSFVDFEEENFVTGTHQSAIDFDVFADGRRSLTIAQFALLIRTREVGQISDAELRKRFELMDADKSGRVEMHEYCLFVLRDQLRRSSERVFDLFKQLDTDSSGALSLEEVHRALTAVMGFDLTPDEAVRLFNTLDVKKTGKLEYAQLNNALRHGAGSADEDKIAAENDVPGLDKPMLAASSPDAPTRTLRRQMSDAGGPVRIGQKKPEGHELMQLGAEASLVIGDDGLDGLLVQLSNLLAAKGTSAITLFRHMDVDKNGRLDLLEFRAARSSAPNGWRRRARLTPSGFGRPC